MRKLFPQRRRFKPEKKVLNNEYYRYTYYYTKIPQFGSSVPDVGL